MQLLNDTELKKLIRGISADLISLVALVSCSLLLLLQLWPLGKIVTYSFAVGVQGDAGRIESSIGSEGTLLSVGPEAIVIRWTEQPRPLAWKELTGESPRSAIVQPDWNDLPKRALVSVTLPMLLLSFWRWWSGAVPWPRFGASVRTLRVAFASGLAAAAMATGLAWLVDSMARLETTPNVWLEIFQQSADFSLLILFVTIAAPVSEECFFRGVLQHRFERAGLVRAGIVVPALIFSGIHFVPHLIPAYLAVGCLFGWLYHRHRSLVVPVVAHSVMNLVAVGQIFSMLE